MLQEQIGEAEEERGVLVSAALGICLRVQRIRKITHPGEQEGRIVALRLRLADEGSGDESDWGLR